MPLSGWQLCDTISGLIVNFVVVVGAGVAIVKLRLYRVLFHRCRTETACSHFVLSEDRILFYGRYIVHNIGKRPIKLNTVNVRLFDCKQTTDRLLEEDKDKELGSRSFDANLYEGLCQIEAGERSIFTLRLVLDVLPAVVFFVCDLKWPYSQAQSGYTEIYVKNQHGGEEQRGITSR